MADALAGSGVRYFVIDAGWFKSAGSDALNSIGDWDISKDMYPDGFKNFIDGVRAKGFIPGIWFEFENLAKNSKLFEEHKDWLLKLDGAPIRSAATATSSTSARRRSGNISTENS
jgi:alpha-galactosidase